MNRTRIYESICIILILIVIATSVFGEPDSKDRNAPPENELTLNEKESTTRLINSQAFVSVRSEKE